MVGFGEQARWLRRLIRILGLGHPLNSSNAYVVEQLRNTAYKGSGGYDINNVSCQPISL